MNTLFLVMPLFATLPLRSRQHSGAQRAPIVPFDIGCLTAFKKEYATTLTPSHDDPVGVDREAGDFPFDKIRDGSRMMACTRMGLRASEWIVVAYFSYLAVAAAVVPRVSRLQRGRALGIAIAVLIAVFTIASFGNNAILLRDWIPLVYIVIGYRLPALLVTDTNPVFERKLLELDSRWQVTTISARLPRAVIELLELAYLCCYPMVPIGIACLYAAGLREESDRFWIVVLLAAFGCYGVLPWLPTRPPRAIEGTPMRSSGLVRILNLRVLGVASVQLNTFPSGHAAASLATALAVGARLPLAGLLLGLLALAIAIGSVVGRYHYAADALSGAALAILGFLISRSM